jgi:hypothetical protein
MVLSIFRLLCAQRPSGHHVMLAEQHHAFLLSYPYACVSNIHQASLTL